MRYALKDEFESPGFEEVQAEPTPAPATVMESANSVPFNWILFEQRLLQFSTFWTVVIETPFAVVRVCSDQLVVDLFAREPTVVALGVKKWLDALALHHS